MRTLDTWSDAVLDVERLKYYVPLYSVNDALGARRQPAARP